MEVFYTPPFLSLFYTQINLANFKKFHKIDCRFAYTNLTNLFLHILKHKFAPPHCCAWSKCPRCPALGTALSMNQVQHCVMSLMTTPLPERPVRIMFNIVRIFRDLLSCTKHHAVVIVGISHAEPGQLKSDQLKYFYVATFPVFF